MTKTTRDALWGTLIALAVGCGGGGSSNPPADLTETIQQVQAVFDDCAGELAGSLFDLFETLAEQLDPANPALPVTVVATDTDTGSIEVTGDLDGDMIDEFTAVITVHVDGTEDPPAGFDADAFAASLDGFATAVAATSGAVVVEFNFGAVTPGVQDLLGTVTAHVQDGVVQSIDSRLDGFTVDCLVAITITGAPANAVAGAYPSLTADARVDGATVGFDAVIRFNGTSVASLDLTVDPDIELNGTVDLDTGVITVTR